jgi:Kef-type K+ transport system membrane component KefB
MTRRIGVSVVVLEILLGVAISPQALGWAEVENALPYLATLGMAFLFFLAGLEIDLHAIRGEPLNRSLVGWVGTFALSCAVALALRAFGLVESWLLVAIFIPVFFIVSGTKLDVVAIFGSGAGIALIFFVAVLVARLPISLAHRGVVEIRQRLAVALYSATTLSLVVALGEIGVANGLVKSSEAAPLVGGAMLTVILYPVVALRLTGQSIDHATARLNDRDGL